jgi:putative phage-type endonuclease
MASTMHPQIAKLIELDADSPEQRTDGWYKLRRDCLTASAVASALGQNPYESANALIKVKCGQGEFKGNAATEHGNKYEDEARMLYEELYGEKTHELGLLPHPTIDFLAGSPDGVTESGRLIEIKCPLRRDIGEGDVPGHYMPQLQLLMEIMDLEVCDFIQYKPECITWPAPREFTVVTVERERDWFEHNLPIMRDFWTKVLWHREHGTEGLTKVRKKRAVSPKAAPPTLVPEVCEV